MNTAYWIKEYIFVLLSYGVVMFLWPEIVFRKWLRGRTLTMRICFDSMVMIALINLFVLGLGLCYILNPWIVRIVFWGTPVLSLAVPFIRENGSHTFKRFMALLTGGYGIKSFGSNVAFGTGNAVHTGRKKVNGRLTNHIVLYALLTVVILYGMIYFSAGVIETHSYGFGDMYTHHKWIYELVQGNVFSRGTLKYGVYPEGMHTFIYLIHTCFGIPIYSVLLFLQPIHVGLFLLSVFLFCKEAFNWRYTGVVVLVLFLTVGYGVVNTVYAFSRLQWTLPQEFAAPAVFICAAFLLRYVKEIKAGDKEEKAKKIFEDENLVVFGLALFVTIAVHFYCTIIAFFLCLAIVPVYFKQIFDKKHFVKLLLTCLIFAFAAMAPMLTALLEGMKFQGSIGWALDIINDSAKENSSQVVTPTVAPTAEPSIDDNNVSDKSTESLMTILQRFARNIVKKNYGSIFSADTTRLYLICAAISLVCIIAFAVLHKIYRCSAKKKGKDIPELQFASPLLTLFIMLVNVMILCYPAAVSTRLFTLPQLIASARLNYYATFFNMAVMLIPLDLAFGLLNCHLKDSGDGAIAIVVAAVAVVVVIGTDNYHGTLYFELTRYNSAVDTTVKIMQENEKNTFTIVSTIDETWQVAEKGIHVELISFLNNALSSRYNDIDTEKVYIFIEKRPLYYAQSYFPVVPSWLADNEKDQAIYTGLTKISTGQENIVRLNLSENVGADYIKIKEDVSYYKNSRRAIIESRAMNWIQAFEKLYPRTLQVYYEDDDFVCYCYSQNPNAVYDLALQNAVDDSDTSGNTGDNTTEEPGDNTSDENENADYVVEYIYDPENDEIIMRIVNNATGAIVDEYIIGD